MRARNGLLTAALCAALVSACASRGERPTEQLTQARTLVEQAARGGAAQLAPAELERARSKLLAAENIANDGKNEDAQWLAEEAVVDAEYAIARTSTAKAEHAAQAVQQGLDTLREEATRGSESGRQ